MENVDERATRTAPPLGSYRYFRDHRLGVDSAVVLFGFAQALATDAVTIVDVGCGRGAMVDADTGERRLHDLRAPGRTVLGIDVDPAGAGNPVIDEFRLIEGDRWPLTDGSIDLVICDWVLEHVTDPGAFVSELARALRPGGAFLARTVSRNSLLSAAARLTPNRAHSRVVGSLQPGRAEQDVFPTAYLMNTLPALRRQLDRDFDWAGSFHPGLEHYAMRWPRLQAAVNGIESRLPRRNQMTLVLSARKRPSPGRHPAGPSDI